MDVSVIRKAHLRRLAQAEGSLAALARRLDTDPNYLSSVMSPNGHRNPGRDLMRRAERAFQIPDGALDLPDQKASAAVLVMQALPDAARDAVIDFIRLQAQAHGLLTVNEDLADYLVHPGKRQTARRGKP